jgi:hypothetical protein
MERLGRGEIANEWRASRERLGELLGTTPHVAAVPGGGLSRRLIEEASAAGYEVLLSCQPTTRHARLGAIAVLGRYTIWANTSSRRAAAFAVGELPAQARLRAEWELKRAGKRLAPALYERGRHVRARWTLADVSGYGPDDLHERSKQPRRRHVTTGI